MRARRARSESDLSWPKPHATEAERPCAYDAARARPLCTDRSAALRPQRLSSARARSPELGAAGGHGQQQRFDASLSVQEGTAVEVQRPSGARAMGYSFIGSYQSASGALPLCDPRPSGASGLVPRLFLRFSLERGGRGLINFETAFERGEMRPSLRRLGRGRFHCGRCTSRCER